MLLPRPRSRPNERRKLTLELDEKPGDPHTSEAVRITPQHLGELSPLRRQATLTAATIRLEEGLTNTALTMFDKLLGSMVRRAENRTREKAIRTVREMQGHLGTLTISCRMLIDAHAQGIDSLGHIGPFDWDRFGSAPLSLRRKSLSP